MTRTPGSTDRPPPSDDGSDPAERISSSAEMTPPTNRRRVIAGVAVPVAAILSWVLATATHSSLWYALVVMVAVLGGALYAAGGRPGGHERARNRDR
jgi:1,4-dihydroxy-2-naphthoate octaprenyltransferase